MTKPDPFDRRLTDPERQALILAAVLMVSEKLGISWEEARQKLDDINSVTPGTFEGDNNYVVCDIPPLLKMTVGRDVLAFAAMTSDPARVIVDRMRWSEGQGHTP